MTFPSVANLPDRGPESFGERGPESFGERGPESFSERGPESLLALLAVHGILLDTP